MSGLADLFPSPRACSLGGAPVLASEARLRDLAALQSVLDGLVPDPLDTLPPLRDDAEGRRPWLRAYLDADAAAVEYGSAESYEFFGHGPGLCVWLSVALRDTPGLTLERIAELAPQMTVAEYGRIHRIFHGIVGGAKAIERALLGPSRETTGQRITWRQALAEETGKPGWTFAALGELTLTQWRALRSGGAEGGGWIPPDAAAERRMVELFGEVEAMRAERVSEDPCRT